MRSSGGYTMMDIKSCCILLVIFGIPLGCCAQADVAPVPNELPQGTVTIFRERATSRLKMFSMKDQWPVRLHKKMTLDGKPLMDMHGQEFVSFHLAAGRHLIEFENYGGANASFDLHPGERVFVRPGFAGGEFFEANRFVLTVVPCTEAIQIGQDAEPMPTKYIEHAGALSEDRLPASC